INEFINNIISDSSDDENDYDWLKNNYVMRRIQNEIDREKNIKLEKEENDKTKFIMDILMSRYVNEINYSYIIDKIIEYYEDKMYLKELTKDLLEIIELNEDIENRIMNSEFIDT